MSNARKILAVLLGLSIVGVASADIGEIDGRIKGFFRRLTGSEGQVLTRSATGTAEWADAAGAAGNDGSTAVVTTVTITGALNSKLQVIGQPDSGYQITAAQSGTVFYEAGAGTLAYLLPPAEVGLHYTFVRHDTDQNGIAVQAGVNDQISHKELTSTLPSDFALSRGQLQALDVHSSITVLCIEANHWTTTAVIGTWTLDGDTPAAEGGGGGTLTVTNLSGASTTLTAADMEGQAYVLPSSLSGVHTITLPAAAAGLNATFILDDTNSTLKIVSLTGDSIHISALDAGSAGYVASTAQGSSVTIVGVSTSAFYTTSIVGTWAANDETP